MKSYNSKIKNNKKVELVMVSKDKDASKALAWAKKERFPWPMIPMNKQRNLIVNKFFKGSVPTYVLTDKDGKALAHGKAAAFQYIQSN